jgi:hypothetical protein
LKEIFDIIGTDKNDGTLFVTGEDNGNKERSVEKSKTLWARLNAVENLNRYDLDITNVVTTNFNDGEKTPNGLVARTDGKGDFITTVQNNLKTLSEADEALTKNVKDWVVGAKELIASKGYVDNAIVAAINEYAEKVDEGDENYATVRINNVDINLDGTQKSKTENSDGSGIIEDWSCDISDETEDRANEITLTDIKDHFDQERETLDKQDYYNAETIDGIVKAVNKLTAKNQENVNRVYTNVQNLMNALQYQYNGTLTKTTTGSLLNF